MLYNAAGQVTQIRFTQNTSGSAYYTETRQYNVLGQLTQLTIPGVVNRTYTFHATQNDGRITQMTDAISGETIDYVYDTLKRLSSAATTGPQWGQSSSYDGVGNMLTTVRTKGTAPEVYLYPDPTNNRLGSGYQWDANGNMTAKTGTPTLNLTYDVENRMIQAVHSLNGTERYVYDPANQRVWKQEPSRTLVYFYGVEGNLLATYGDQSNTDYNVYFGAKLIWAEASTGLPAGPAGTDRLGSVVSRNGAANRYFPYGQEPAATGDDRTKFATYHRDATTSLDYARNRYYSSTIARFTTADPYARSGRLSAPQSLNRYSYVGNDPVDFNDPGGLIRERPPDPEGPPRDPLAGLRDLVRRPGTLARPHLVGEDRPTLPTVPPVNSYRTDAFAAIHGLSQNCKDKLAEAEVDIDGLAATAMTINFWDARNPALGNRTQNWVFKNGVFTSLLQTKPRAAAYVVHDRAGNRTRNVVLKPNFFGTDVNPTSSVFRNAVLVHETLHIHRDLDDDELFGALGIVTQDTYMDASESITEWLKQDCPDVVITPPL